MKKIPLKRRTEGEREAYHQGYNAGFQYAVRRLARFAVENSVEMQKELLQSDHGTTTKASDSGE